MREDTVRLRRSEFARGGVEALKATVAPGPPPVKTEAALVSSRLCSKLPLPTGPTGRSAPHGRDRGARGSKMASRSCPRRCEKNFRWRRPGHTLKGRQIAAEIDRGTAPSTAQGSGRSRRHHLLYGDESEALTPPYLARAWALRGRTCAGSLQAKEVAIIAHSIMSRAS